MYCSVFGFDFVLMVYGLDGLVDGLVSGVFRGRVFWVSGGFWFGLVCCCYLGSGCLGFSVCGSVYG